MKCAYQTHLADWNGYPHLWKKSAVTLQYLLSFFLFFLLLFYWLLPFPILFSHEIRIIWLTKENLSAWMYYYVVSTSFCSCRVCQEKRYPVVVSPGLWMWFNSIYLLSGHRVGQNRGFPQKCPKTLGPVKFLNNYVHWSL